MPIKQYGGDPDGDGKYLNAYEYPTVDADKVSSDSPATELNKTYLKVTINKWL